MFCQNCGMKVEDGVQICPSCKKNPRLVQYDPLKDQKPHPVHFEQRTIQDPHQILHGQTGQNVQPTQNIQYGMQQQNQYMKQQPYFPYKKPINVCCLVGFILACVSWLLALWGIVAGTGLVFSIVGVVEASRDDERLKGLGIAGIPIAAASLCYTLYVLIIAGSLLSLL